MKCIGCNTKECGACGNCGDMKKYGGPGKRKKACVKRACLATIKKNIQPAVSSCIIKCMEYYMHNCFRITFRLPILLHSCVSNLKPPVAATFLKSQECCHMHRIIGDGNCLFRSFSYILFCTQDRHLELLAILTEFTSLNAAYFLHICVCNPESVQEHVEKMKKPCVWGTHAEIMALAATLNVPVFVAIKKNPYEYYWAKYAG